MIYRFKLVSDEVTSFSRTIEIDSEATFLDLRHAILESVGYTKDQLNSFFICDDDWQKEQEITLEDMGSSSDQDIYLMEETPLYELIEEEGQKMIFVFDYLTERAFFMELQQIITNRDLSEPICTIKMGTPPPQNVNLDEFEEKIDTNAAAASSADLDNDFYGDSEYNDEELPEGFDDL